MNLRPSSDPRPTAPTTAVGPVRSQRAPSREASAAAPEADVQAADQDRVEISAAARAQAGAAPEAASLEIEVARVALRAGAELSPARLHELRERVRTGYYDQPPAVDRIAEAAARNLSESGGRP